MKFHANAALGRAAPILRRRVDADPRPTRYFDGPAASRASARSSKNSTRTTRPSRSSQTCASGRSSSTPLARPRVLTRKKLNDPIAGIEQVLLLVLDAIEDVGVAPKPPPYGLMAPGHRRKVERKAISRLIPLDLGVVMDEDRGPVVASLGIHDRPDGLDVLLRHRRAVSRGKALRLV